MGTLRGSSFHAELNKIDPCAEDFCFAQDEGVFRAQFSCAAAAYGLGQEAVA